MMRLVLSAIRLVTALIPAKRMRKRVRRRLLHTVRLARLRHVLPAVRARAASHEAACRAKLARGERLKVAFLVCDVAMFTGESVFRRLRDDPRCDCFIAVVPRMARGEAFLRETLEKTLGTLRARYGEAVRLLCDERTGAPLPLAADIVYSTVIYEHQTFPAFTTERLSRRSLVVILNYGYGGYVVSDERRLVFLPNIVLAWRSCVANASTREMNVRRNPMLAANTVVTGYCKMDRLPSVCEAVAQKRAAAGAASRRKKVMLCPHHTIERTEGSITLSTFLRTNALFLKLPALFPEVDFVFRPHPLLLVRLAQRKWWGPEKVAAWCRQMAAHPNVEFQRGGDYFESFAESDALIHDCGSFLAEYFYTGKPQCYLMDDEATTASYFLPLGQEMLAHVTRATTDDQVVAFIRHVVIAGDDPDRTARDAFAAKAVCVNHPDATARVIAATLDALEARPEAPGR